MGKFAKVFDFDDNEQVLVTLSASAEGTPQVQITTMSPGRPVTVTMTYGISGGYTLKDGAEAAVRVFNEFTPEDAASSRKQIEAAVAVKKI